MHPRPLLPLVLLLATLAAARPAPAARSAEPAPSPAAFQLPDVLSGEQPVPDAPWLDSLDLALARSAVDYKPVLLFATSENCVHCLRMKRLTFPDPAVRRQLRQFVLLELDVNRHPLIARQLAVEGTPTCLILASDGRIMGRMTGFVEPDALVAALAGILRGAGEQQALEARQAALLRWLDDGATGPTNHWPEIAQAVGSASLRPELRLRMSRWPATARADLVALLGHPALATRLGALELLEQWSGETRDYDAWQSPAANAAALANWRAWAADTSSVARAGGALSDEEIARRLEDVASGDRDRALRAARALEAGGPAIAAAIARFVHSRVDLSPEAAGRLRELRYAVALPAGPDFDPTAVAHRLVFGNLDGRLQALRQLGAVGPAAVPIAREILAETTPLLRAAAVEALLRAGGKAVVPDVERLLQSERDPEVIISSVKGLGTLRSRTGLAVMLPFLQHPEEDVVIATLESLARLRSHEPKEAVKTCLTDGRWRVRAAALKTVQTLRIVDLADAVAERLQDEDAYVRYGAVQALPELSRERSIALLPGVFERDDELKGPVLQAVVSLDIVPTKRMMDTLARCEPGVIVAALDALGHGGAKVAPALLRFVGHEDLDVACTALRALASAVVERPDVQRAYAERLRAGRPEEQLTVLEVLADQVSGLSKIMRLPPTPGNTAAPPSSVGGVTEDGLLEAFGHESPVSPAPTGVVASAGTGPAEEDLLAAFTGGPTPEPVAVAPAAADGAALEGLLAAFGGGPTGDQEEEAAPTAPATDALGAAVRTAGASTNELVRRAALVLLAALGDDPAVQAMASQLKELPESSRAQLAAAVAPKPDAPMGRALLERLLDDPSAAVRQQAAERATEYLRVPGVADALLSRMANPESGLKASTLGGWSMQNRLNTSGARATVRPWAERWLRTPPRAALQVLAITLVQQLWRTGDDALLEPLTRHDSEFVRRAAYHALLAKAPRRGEAFLPRAADDPSARVRQTVSAAFRNEEWVNEFDDQDSASSYSYDANRGALGAVAKTTLEKLASDPDPRVAMGSLLALLEAGQLKEGARLLAALQALPDRARALSQTFQAVTQARRPMPELATLLPLLEESDLDDDDKETARRLLTRKDPLPGPAVSESGVAPAPAPAPAAEAPLRAVLFVEHGCESCARVRTVLAQAKAAFPNLEVTELELLRVEARQWNRVLCDRFNAPARVEGLTPVLFAAGGYLAGEEELRSDRLVDLLVRSMGQTFEPTPPAVAHEPEPIARVEDPVPAVEPVLQDSDLLAREEPVEEPSRWPLVWAGLGGALAVLVVLRIRRAWARRA